MANKINNLPSLSLLRDLFEYRDGALRWRVDIRATGRRPAVKAGDIVDGYAYPSGYRLVNVQGRPYRLHRLVYQVVHGDLTPELEIDHINRDKRDNRIENLRAVTHVRNLRNLTRQSRNTTGITGVRLHRKRRKLADGSEVERLSYTAQWFDLSGRLALKHFPIAKHGESEAFRLACEHRQAMIAELNRCGAGYTPHHGLA